MLAAFNLGEDSGGSCQPSFRNPGVVRGVCQSLANAGAYRSSLVQRIKTRLRGQTSQKIHLDIATKRKER